jgi:hypothetical protein
MILFILKGIDFYLKKKSADTSHIKKVSRYFGRNLKKSIDLNSA